MRGVGGTPATGRCLLPSTSMPPTWLRRWAPLGGDPRGLRGLLPSARPSRRRRARAGRSPRRSSSRAAALSSSPEAGAGTKSCCAWWKKFSAREFAVEQAEAIFHSRPGRAPIPRRSPRSSRRRPPRWTRTRCSGPFVRRGGIDLGASVAGLGLPVQVIAAADRQLHLRGNPARHRPDGIPGARFSVLAGLRTHGAGRTARISSTPFSPISCPPSERPHEPRLAHQACWPRDGLGTLCRAADNPCLRSSAALRRARGDRPASPCAASGHRSAGHACPG